MAFSKTKSCHKTKRSGHIAKRTDFITDILKGKVLANKDKDGSSTTYLKEWDKNENGQVKDRSGCFYLLQSNMILEFQIILRNHSVTRVR